MAKREVKDWITVNHQHLPIYEGESKKEVAKDYAEKVEKKKTTKSVKDDTKKKKPSDDDKDESEDDDSKTVKINDKEIKVHKKIEDPKKEEQEAPKKKLDERLSGDDLLDAQDMIEELRANEADVDDDGYVTVYHRTNEQAYKSIMDSKEMIAKEDGVFFSTKSSGQAEGYGDNIVELKVPVEKLQIDDEFGDEAHVRIPLKNRNQKLDISEYLVKKGK